MGVLLVTVAGEAVVFLTLATRCVGYGASWERLWYRTSPVTAYALLRITWYELQSDLQMTATCPGLGHGRERLSCKLKLAAASVRLGAA